METVLSLCNRYRLMRDPMKQSRTLSVSGNKRKDNICDTMMTGCPVDIPDHETWLLSERRYTFLAMSTELQPLPVGFYRLGSNGLRP